ncbi:MULTISPECIES: hypothetical protein [Brevibacterium]|jgi:hypothetical protein|uniref:Uncharacterized protein n=1 Tax=Brevibacterium casei TaxID=33889 RepID=A0A7T3ZZ06_9MICO|nr:hypothetical protein [Brevibacterium casei]QQB14297.1 hypothetical protein I6H47_16395 [Brevibacterium casei]
MAAGVVLIVLPPLLLLLAGVLVLVQAARGRRTGSTPGFVLRLIAGIGVLLCALLALSGLWLEINYAVVFFPVIALILGGVWLIAFLGAALLADWLTARGGN